MLEITRHLNQARRVIFKTPLLSAVAVVSLALGIAAATTVFSVVHSFLLRPLPYEDPGSLAVMWGNPVARAGDQWPVSAAEVLDWREGLESFAEIAAYRFESANLTGIERSERIDITMATDNFFSVVRGEAPLLGRAFVSGDGESTAEKVVVIKETLWERQFGADPSVVGKLIELDGESRRLVGVMPRTFDFMSGEVEAWVPLDLRSQAEDREARDLLAAGRLADGVSREQGKIEALALADRLAERYPDTQEGWTINVQSVRDVFPGPTDSQLVKVLQAVALLVLLVACVNVAGLLLAKADSRQKEMALRTALGAGRGRLFNRLMTESLLMASAAGALGIGFAYFGVRMTAEGMPEILPMTFWPRMDGPVILFALMAALISGVVFGFGPAMQAVRHPNLRATLGDGGRGGSEGQDRKRALSFFVMAELALALAILIGASVMTDLFHNKLSVDPGFSSDGVLTAQLTLPEFRYADDGAVARAVQDLEHEMSRIAGVESVTLAGALPRSRFLNRTEMVVEGRPVEEDEAPRVGLVSVTPSFLGTLDIGLLQGRGFQSSDDADGVPVIVVNRTFYERHLAADGRSLEQAVGMRVEMDERTWTVVGIVPDYAQERLDGLAPRSAIALLPMAQRPVRNVYPILRSGSDPMLMVAGLRAAVSTVQPDQPVGEIRSLDEHMERELAGPSVISKVLYGIGLLALVLAAMGIYGVMAFRVSRQTREIGIRLALGASPSQVVGRATGQGLRLAAGGLVAGLVPASAIIMLVQSVFEAGQAEGVAPLGAVVGGEPLLKVVLLLGGTAVLACLLPSLKASRVDPQETLRAD